MTQTEWVLKTLKRGKKITALDAFLGCGTLKLSNRISELKAKGHNIVAEIVVKDKKRFCRYSMPRAK
jgi:hypothetical protein